MSDEDCSDVGQGPTLRDIGALLVHAPATMAGTEIEASRPSGRPRHVAIIARRTAERVAHTAVFPALPEGHYQLHCRPDGPVRLHATVVGGRVTEARWPDAGAGKQPRS